MAKALYGHVGTGNQQLLDEVRRLRAKNRSLEFEMARLRAENDRLAAEVSAPDFTSDDLHRALREKEPALA